MLTAYMEVKRNDRVRDNHRVDPWGGDIDHIVCTGLDGEDSQWNTQQH